jgi:hypothetical protein
MNTDYLPAIQAQENDRIVGSLLHPSAVLIRQLLTRSGRQGLNQILIDDEENIAQALEADVEIHSVFHSGGEVPSTRLIRKLPEHIPVYEVARKTCKQLFENNRISRIFAIACRPPPPDKDLPILVMAARTGISIDTVASTSSRLVMIFGN